MTPCRISRGISRSGGITASLHNAPQSPRSIPGSRFAPKCRSNSTKRRKMIACSAGGSSESFFYRPRRGSEYEEPITEDNSELVKIVSELGLSEKEYVMEHVSKDAVDAMHRTVSGMLGLLPANQFQVKVTAHRDPLSNILLSSLCTGYALKNAEFRMQLSQSMRASQAHLAPDQDSLDEAAVELSTSERNKLSPETLAYIETLEARLQSVESNPGAPSPSRAGPTNSLLSYVREMTPEAINKLSQDASREVIQAFNVVIGKTIEQFKPCPRPPNPMLGRSRFMLPDPQFESHRGNFGATFSLSRESLTDSLLWCMLVGYYTKGVEYRLSLEKCMLGEREVRERREGERHMSWLERLGSLFDSQS